MQTGKVNFLVDASWGSSGKGATSTRLADIHNIEHGSVSNYPNAGHVVRHEQNKWVFKALSSTLALRGINGKKVKTWMSPNSGFFVEQLNKELSWFDLQPGRDVFIHERAMVVEQKHADAEAAGPGSTKHLASTMSGSGAGYTAKAMRGQDVVLAKDVTKTLKPTEFYHEMRSALANGETFLHEVSQGFALSLNHGTHIGKCTFRDCTPQQGAADLMCSPQEIGDVYLNLRTFPIRVGNVIENGEVKGESGGCMPDQTQTSWQEIAANCDMPEQELQFLLSEIEMTTVTHRLRKAFTHSNELLKYAASACGATKLVVNFPQYLHWSCYKVHGGRECIPELHEKVRSYVDMVEDVTGIPVAMLCTGPEHQDYIFLE